jgi:excisionase family DNA binding protein
LNQIPNPTAFLKVEEFARETRTSRALIWRLIREGEIATVRVGSKARRIPASELTRLAATATTEATERAS